MAGALKFWNGEEDIIIGGSGERYSLPVATTNELGGVKSGGDVTIDADGLISVTDGAIGTSNIASKAVTTATIADGAVTVAKIRNGAVTALKLATDAKSKGVAVTLPAAGWVDNTQNVAVEGVTADNNVLVAAAPASREAWNDAEIYCSAQGNGTLTFVCGSAPAEAVTANVVILV